MGGLVHKMFGTVRGFRSSPFFRDSLLKHLFHLFLCALLAGCATGLPDVSRLLKESAEEARIPQITGPRRNFPPEKAVHRLAELEREAGTTDLLQSHITLMESLSGHTLSAGNRATLLVDGPAVYAAMLKAIAEARDHINFETFIFNDDEIGRRFADLFLAKQAEGVQVNLIYDSVGCKDTPSAFFKRLRDGGVSVLEFNPINPLKARGEDLLIHRDHRKVVVVDGKTAFTGGVNVSSVYSGSISTPAEGRQPPALGWRDTHVMIEGPAVAQIQNLFLETWQSQKGPRLASRKYFPTLSYQGRELITVVGSTPGNFKRLTYIMYVAAILKAQRSIHLTNAYFVPDRQTLHALEGAAQRRVDVALVLPSFSDSSIALSAGRSHYEDLLESQVTLYERRDRLLHAKTAVIDGVWSTIGSTNFDIWSFQRNNEINAIIIGIDFSNQMEALFQKDLEQSNRISRDDWARRPLWERMQEWFGRLLSYWL
jgi:cardiolipin synthase A/B